MYTVVHIQPRKDVLDQGGHTAPTRQHELAHIDDTYHTDHTDQEYICSERPRSRTVGNIIPITEVICPRCASESNRVKIIKSQDSQRGTKVKLVTKSKIQDNRRTTKVLKREATLAR